MAGSEPILSVIKQAKELKPTKKNPRLDWTDDQRAAFKKSLAEFGDISGVVFNRTTKQLVGGNKRREEFITEDSKITIVTELGKPDRVGTVAWGYIDFQGTRYNYREVVWPKKKELAANLAANKHGADWDWTLVSEVMKEIDDVEYLSTTGFEDHDISNLIAAEWSPEKAGEMPESGGGHDKVDMIILDSECRKIFNKAKKRLGEKDDLFTLKKLCNEHSPSV